MIHFLSFLIPTKENIWYRPLSSPIFFFLSKQLFGYNPFGYHLIVLITHVFTMWLLYLFVKLISKNKFIAILSGLFYGIHQLHSISLSWLATYPFILGPLFFLLTFIFYYKNKYVLSYLFFLLGLLSWEVLVIIPIILFFFQVLIQRKIRLKILIPYILLSLLLILFRIFIFKTNVTSDLYQISFSWEFFNLIKFYFLRLIGIPMLIISMPQYVQLLSIFISICLLTITLIGIYFLISNKHYKIYEILFYISILFFGMSPFLFMPNHIAPYYLSLSLIGFSIIYAYGIYNFYLFLKNNKYFITIIFLLFFINHYIGINWTYETHWIFKRSIIAKKLISDNKLTQPIGSEEYFSLGGDYAKTAF